VSSTQHEKERTLQREVARLVEGALPGVDVLALELTGKERFCVFVDHAQGVDHALCERVTNVLRRYLDKYSVEVSSPGPERPLRTRDHFARAVGGARGGDPELARNEVAKLTEIQASLKGQKGFDWATQVEIQRRSAAGWLARADKKDAEAMALLRSAADLEDSTDKHPVTPGSILPAREQLADLLTELGQPAAALTEYEASLRSAPARFNSYDGAARAAEGAGKKEEAKTFRDRLTALCGGSVPTRVASAITAAK